MSEIQKPVEEVVAAVEAAPAEVVAAVEEVAPVEVAPVEVAAATTTTEEATPEAAVETPKKFEGEGVIGYKAPGGFIK